MYVDETNGYSEFEGNWDRKKYRGEYYNIVMYANILTNAPTATVAGKSDYNLKGKAYCSACFDVKKDEDIKAGSQGIGGCIFYDSDEIFSSHINFNFFGTVEATSSDAF